MEKAEVIKAFHLMWDNYPESAMLIDKKRNIIAANKVAPSTGRIEGNKCALVEPLEQHKGCRAEEAWKNGEASYRKKVGKLGDVVSFWIPAAGFYMTRINEVLYFVLYDLCKIKKTQNKSASVFSIGTPEWNRTTAHGSGGRCSIH